MIAIRGEPGHSARWVLDEEGGPPSLALAALAASQCPHQVELPDALQQSSRAERLSRSYRRCERVDLLEERAGIADNQVVGA